MLGPAGDSDAVLGALRGAPGRQAPRDGVRHELVSGDASSLVGPSCWNVISAVQPSVGQQQCKQVE